MVSALNANIPNAPLVDPNTGDVTQPWRLFLIALYSRTGAAGGVSSGANAAAITAETTARTAADSALGVAISNEATARQAAITTETAARIAADAAETAARITADNDLQTEIGALQSGGSMVTYTWTQATPAATWTVAHNLNRFPSVEVVDSTGAVVEGDILFTNADTITLTFAGAFSGLAYLN